METHKPVTAVFTALAMMVACAVPVLLPVNMAYAVEDTGATCAPTSGSIGDSSTEATEDTGVATWVGRDMYIGDKPAGQDEPVALTGGMNDSNKPTGSYAVEAEGLTLVKGKLAINQVKDSWGYNKNGGRLYPGFRFGAVGFGANFRPANNNVALAVAGQGSLITQMKSSPTETSGTSTVGAWTHGGWVGNGSVTDPKDQASFTASLGGDPTWWVSKTEDWNNSIGRNNNETDDNGKQVHSWGYWGKTNPLNLTYTSNGKSTITDYLNYKNTGKDYGETIKQQSNQLVAAGLNAKTTVTTTDEVNDGTVTRQKYSEVNDSHKIQISYDGSNKEKLITFTGTGNAADDLQIFNLPGDALNHDGYNGIAFKFTNIPASASIAVNVTGTAPIEFHTGWSFYWGDEEIGGFYGNSNSPEQKAKYDTAAKSIMWNFAETAKLTIRGGQIKEGNATWVGSDNSFIGQRSSEDGKSNYITSDDPAAAMLGSIMVPNGSFDDHVTTNGRVWVGNDFMMNSPYALKAASSDQNKDNEGYWLGSEKVRTASILDMDMERHNFGWSASVSSSCAIIGWDKVDESGAALSGTSWGVYKTPAAAAAGATTKNTGWIRNVIDNSTGDSNPAGGVFEVGNLQANANYYIRELDSNDPNYETNGLIYKIEAGADVANAPSANPYKSIVAVYKVTDDGKAVDITNDASENKLLTDQGAIINPREGSAIEWGKKADGGSFEGLPGSEWVLKQTAPETHEWLITDDVVSIDNITIMDASGSRPTDVMMPLGSSMSFNAVITPDEANKTVTWSSNPTTALAITSSGTSATVRAMQSGQVTLTATAVDGKTDRIVITVNEPDVKSVEIRDASNQAFAGKATRIMSGKPLQLTASVIDNDDQPSDVQPTWEVPANQNALTVSANGLLTAGSVQSNTTVRVTASVGNQKDYLDVTVTPAGTMLYIQSINDSRWGDPYIHAYTSTGPIKNVAWPGKRMEWNSVANRWEVLIETTEPFTIIVTNVGGTIQTHKPNQGGDYVNASASQNEFLISNVSAGGSATVTPITSRSQTMRLNRASANWTPIDTTDWGADKQKADQDPAVGKFKVDGLSDGTYTLQENKAPDGYLINPQVYAITIDKGTVTWAPEPPKDSNDLHWIGDTPTQVEWDKVDAGYSADDTNPSNNPIAGSKWRLEMYTPGQNGAKGSYATLNGYGEITDCTSGDCAASLDKNNAPGKFKITGLNVGKYRLYETEAPNGYSKIDAYHYFELSTANPSTFTKGTVDSFGNDGSVTGGTTVDKVNGDIAVGNYRNTGVVDWSKVAQGETTKILPGSEWRLTYASYDKKDGVPADIVCAITDSSTTCTQGEATVTSAWARDKASDAGKFKFEELPWGDYELVETKAPDGYNLDSTPKTFVIGPNGSNEFTFEVKLGNIENEPGVVLPNTGGSGHGNLLIIGAGFLLVSMAGCALAMRREI